jgi:hypothetical protein
MRLGLVLGGVLLAIPGLVACGDDDSSGDQSDQGEDPKSVSVETFCAAAEKFEHTFSEMDTTDLASGVPIFKDSAQELKDAGTPKEMPDDAREGLRLTLDKIIGLPDDATESDMSAIFEFTDEEKAKSMAFESYLDDTCDYRDGLSG